ncbi:MAG: hypothetical protein QE263_03365 [Vampirovibrionales bacterium]|nr:hypothetical protein [Vampirovibrionales bacterium]
MDKPKPSLSGGSQASPARWMSMADPIHGIVQFDRYHPAHQLVLAVMNSGPMQRLRRIRQMGLAEFVFPNATHSRFVHSVGATHLMMEALAVLQRDAVGRELLAQPYPGCSTPLETLLLLAILVHDIGHAPLSHTLEELLELDQRGLSHDYYWNRKILMEDPELQKIWQQIDPNLPEALLSVMGHGPHDPHPALGVEKQPQPQHFLASLVSSQLDMDRLDYLLRDSHFLGVRYGNIESQRIVSTLVLAHNQLNQPVVAVREEAVPAVEHYLFGRHEAYKMALHPLDKAAEVTLKKTLLRFRWVREEGLETGYPADILYQFLANPETLSTSDYLSLDDHSIWEAAKGWSRESQDPMLKSLANRLLRHELFKFLDLRAYGINAHSLHDLPEAYQALAKHYESRGLSMSFGFEEVILRPKPLYRSDNEPIWIKTARGEVVDLKEVSSLPLSHPLNPRTERHLIFVWDSEAKKVLRQALR